jgi:predicted nucleic-acid-binding protein
LTTPVDLFVDTNVVMRFLLDDDQRMAGEARRLVGQAESGVFEIHISHLVIAEVVWTMTTQYRLPKQEIVDLLVDLLDLRSLRVDHKDMLRRALLAYRSNNVDFVDAYHVADCERRGLRVICSYDRDFDRMGAHRVEPGALVGSG